MSYSKEEVRLNFIEHIAGVLLYFYVEEEMSEDEFDEASTNCGDIASLLVQSMNLDFYDIDSENAFKISVKLEDFQKFITGLQNRTVIGD